MTKVGRAASVELGVSCWCLRGHRPEAARTSHFSRDTRNLNFYVRSLALQKLKTKPNVLGKM